jgi:hypothetical protein
MEIKESCSWTEKWNWKPNSLGNTWENDQLQILIPFKTSKLWRQNREDARIRHLVLWLVLDRSTKPSSKKVLRRVVCTRIKNGKFGVLEPVMKTKNSSPRRHISFRGSVLGQRWRFRSLEPWVIAAKIVMHEYRFASLTRMNSTVHWKVSEEAYKPRMFQEEFYSCIPNITVWPLIRKRLHLKAYKLSIVEIPFVKLLLEQPALPVEVTLNRNYPRSNSVYFATLWQFKALYMSSE